MTPDHQSEALSPANLRLFGQLQQLDSMLGANDVQQVLERVADLTVSVSQRIETYCSTIRFLHRDEPVAFQMAVERIGGIFEARVRTVLGSPEESKSKVG